VWNLTHAGARIIPKARLDGGNPTIGPQVSPGTYTVKVTADGKVLTGTFEVRLDPRVREPRGSYRGDGGSEIIEIAPRVADGKKSDEGPWLKRGQGNAAVNAEARDQERLALQLRDDISKVSDMVAEIRNVCKQLHLQAEILEGPRYAALRKQGKELVEQLDALEGRLHNPKAVVSYDILAQKGGARLYSQLSGLLDNVNSADGPPTQGMTDLAAELAKELDQYVVRLESLKKEELASLNNLAKKLQAPIIWVPAPNQKK